MEIVGLPFTAVVSLLLGFAVLALAYTEIDKGGDDHHPWSDYD